MGNSPDILYCAITIVISKNHLVTNFVTNLTQLNSTSIYGRRCKHMNVTHLFNITTYKTTHHLFHVLIYIAKINFYVADY